MTTNQSNPQLDMAFDYVVNTNRSVFLTGKAGTGKTTFLQRLKSKTPKRITIVAPTGVAAINAGGVTIHSLFQLPFTPFLPNQSAVESKKFSREKINLIKSIDLLVIDEISMVRCDVLDAIDSVLRQFRNRHKPFGGVQLLLIGDINQLSPVAKDEEWQQLMPYYETVYFFSSRALNEQFPVIVELKHIYRQKDTTFIDLLNKVRNNKMDDEAYDLLNSRLDPDIFYMDSDDGYITLTSHNATSRQINSDKLERLDSESYYFKATINGEFSEYSYPTDENLELKLGAQVMFIRNDSGKDKRYFNGKIGKIVHIGEDRISVATDEFEEIEVSKDTWKNIKYTLDPSTKKIEEQELGAFTQYPLKLAYAITIHKSQGLTFDKVIIDAQAAFSSGQVYVALSRCRTLDGIILSTPISNKSIRLDYNIHQFNNTISKEELTIKKLHKAQFDYQEELIMDLLDYNQIIRPLMNLHKQLSDNSPPIDKNTVQLVTQMLINSDKNIGSVILNFQKQIKEILTESSLPEDNEFLQERLKKASAYFEIKIKEVLVEPLSGFHIQTENKSIKETIVKALDTVNKANFVKLSGFKLCEDRFTALTYIQTKVNSEIDFEKQKLIKSASSGGRESRISKHPDLYADINRLRKGYAAENGVEDYQIFTLKALIGIANNLPTDFKSLESISGIGRVTSKRFGAEIIETVRQYCEQHNITPNETVEEVVKTKKPVGETFKISLNLFKEGKSPKEIAEIRGLNIATIYNHIGRFINSGEVNIDQVIPSDKLQMLDNFYNEHSEISLVDAKNQLGDTFSFEELRIFTSYKYREKASLIG